LEEELHKIRRNKLENNWKGKTTKRGRHTLSVHLLVSNRDDDIKETRSKTDIHIFKIPHRLQLLMKIIYIYSLLLGMNYRANNERYETY
jgi:hypothetical protein